MKSDDADTGLKGAKGSARNAETKEIMKKTMADEVDLALKGAKEAAGKEEMGEDKKKAAGEV